MNFRLLGAADWQPSPRTALVVTVYCRQAGGQAGSAAPPLHCLRTVAELR